MLLRCFTLAALLIGWVLLSGSTPAVAHPHVWIVARGELVYRPDGALSAIRFAWTFDDAFSAFAAQGLDKNSDGKLSREELAELAEVNVTSLKEFDYFTFGKSGEQPIVFEAPRDYWLEADEKKQLTLHFTLPAKAAPKGAVVFDIYDPTYFVAFQLGAGTPITLSGAPKDCKLETTAPQPAATSTNRLSESFFNSLSAASKYGSQFSNRIAVRCP